MDFLKQIFQTNPSIIKIGFEDIKIVIEKTRINSNEYIIINTMPDTFQMNLISGTIYALTEESIINNILDNYEMKHKKIVLYGLNTIDETVEKKAKQLQTLGFSEIFIYYSGMFEWLLLQELYGHDEFPTTEKIQSIDILKYRPRKILDILRINSLL